MCRIIILSGLLFLMLSGCNNKTPDAASVVELHLKHARDKVVYISAIPFGDEKKVTEDSAKIESGDAVIRLKIKNKEERPYILKVSGTDIKITFVNDSKEISITANIINPSEFLIEKSKANAVLQNFLKQQEKLSGEGSIISQEMAKLRSPAGDKENFDSLQKKYDRKLDDFFYRYRSFADTVSSPGVFLYVYSSVDYGKDYNGLREFMQNALKRFPGHSQIKRLHNETIEFLKVFEEEFQPGQELPSLQLPDISGIDYNTWLSRGKYVFIDFWSTWCSPCLDYDSVKKKLYETYSPDKLQLISIALDAEKDNWRSYINRKKYSWTQLIDEKVWKGEVIKRLRIDSIPYNLLLDPKGIILRKAIPKDSVQAVLSDYMK